MFGQDRDELRKMYATAWRKRSERAPLSPLEAQIAAVVEWHPEYHEDVTSDDLEREYTPDGGRTNPFLHMGLHLGIREQVSTNRPAGIAKIHETLVAQAGDAHAAEHQMIECLAETLWEAQNANTAPDEQRYLRRLSRLTR
ncbi:MAG: DUF1841 family protein [Gammaproteobacteria bacterium]|nr:DUF1841 family protein [Gammaproteobacteria bacterium]NNC56556.1 DUF1841 family protein [Woeseiaceae bacterium]